MANLNRPEFDEPREVEGFRARRARVGRQLGSQKLGASLWEIPAGQAAYPYHWHHAEEEMLVVLEGTPSLRSPDGWRELATGEVVAFPPGEEGVHQLMNRTESPVRFLAFSTQPGADIVMYPDSGKLGAYERRPEGGGLQKMFRIEDEVDYHHGEAPPSP
jgi:uncharacterized cupin superfamily protein